MECLNENSKTKVTASIAEAGDKDTVLAVLGDVSPNTNTRTRFFAAIAPHWKRVLFVPGNHDYWHSFNDMGMSDEKNEQMAKETGITLLQMGEAAVDDVVFLGATLWSRPDWQCLAWVRDYERMMISEQGSKRRPTPRDITTLHEKHRAWFEAKLREHGGKKVVGLSHHAPSWSLCTDVEDPINTAYYSDCDDLVEKTVFWAHGHTHTARLTGKILCNPRGYPGESTGYVKDWCIDI